MERFLDRFVKKHFKIPAVKDNQMELLQVIISLMKIYQIWPNDNKTLKSRLRFFCFYAHCYFIIIGSTSHLIFQILYKESRVFSLMVYDFSILLGGVTGFQSIPNFYVFQHRTKKLVVKLGNFNKFGKPPGIEIHEAVMNGICKAYYIIAYSLAPVILIYKLLENCPDNNDMVCGFVFPAYFPGTMTSMRRKFFLVFQVISLFNAMLFGFGVLWAFLQISNIICLYIKRLHTMLKNIAETNDIQSRRAQMIFAVKYHHHIIELYDEFFECCKGTFVIYAVWIPVIMGVMTYTLTVQFDVQLFADYLLWGTALCITCIFGQNMISESEHIAYLAYMSMPSDGDLITGRFLAMMIMRSQRPMFVPAGSLTYCGYALIVTVLQTTYSYLTLLKTTGRG